MNRKDTEAQRPEGAKQADFLTNQFELAAPTVALIYRRRWQIELSFRWIKQHPRRRGFFSTSPNGVRVQIGAALCAFLRVAIAKRRKNLTHSLWEIPKVVSVSSLKQFPLQEILVNIATSDSHLDTPNRLEMNCS